jgi:hypothetical protein
VGVLGWNGLNRAIPPSPPPHTNLVLGKTGIDWKKYTLMFA